MSLAFVGIYKMMARIGQNISRILLHIYILGLSDTEGNKPPFALSN
jgi:hypothetical protein